MAMRNSSYRFEKVKRAEPRSRGVAERLGDFCEIYVGLDGKALLRQASRCVACGIPMCADSCPLDNRIPVWMEIAHQEKYAAAARTARTTNPMPEVTGRICPSERLCEGGCALSTDYGPVTIREMERYLAGVREENLAAEMNHSIDGNGSRVAVVGSGPAGLSCADFLSRLGHEVSVYERDRHPGGLLRQAIPTFKLDRSIVEKKVLELEGRGVVFECGAELGNGFGVESLLGGGNAAVFVGTGAGKPIDVPDLEGRGLSNIVPAYDFLSNGAFEVRGRRVLVLGGGDSAMDCARTALRLGAREVACAFRESEEIRPGSPREYAVAKEEGVRMFERLTPVRFAAGPDAKVAAVELARVDCSATDDSGRPVFRLLEGSPVSETADVVILSFGFLPSPPAALGEAGVETDDRGRIVTDGDMMTNVPGVFAGGDAARGSSLVSWSLRDGREAAFGIHRYLCRHGAGRAGL